MSILNAFLINNCTEEQANLLINCFDTLSRIGLVEIEFNMDEVLSSVDNEDLFSVIQACYEKIRTFQKLAFDSLELQVNNREDISAPSDLLLYLDQLENSNQSKLICEIIEQSPTPEDALVTLLEQVNFADTSTLLPVIEVVPASLMERLYQVHFTEESLIQSDAPVLKPIDERKRKLLEVYWNVRELNSLKTYILENKLNLPIKKSVYMTVMKKEMQDQTIAANKKTIARKLLEACLVMNVQWKDIKKGMRLLANDLYEDTLFKAELSYEIDNLCMRENINESL